jgi:hypothetical protein
VNPPEQAREHFATIRDPIAFAHDAIGERRVDDKEECVSFLLERLWKLALTYAGSLLTEIADELGISRSLVSRLLRELAEEVATLSRCERH